MGLISKEIKIIPNSRSDHYRNLGYEIKNGRDVISIGIEDLLKGSKYIVEVFCDCCGNIGKSVYKDYSNLVSKHGNYYCEKCKGIRGKETCIKKYGYENISQVPGNRDKFKETCIDRYGVDNPNKSDIVREKTKITCLKKYGTEYAISSNEVRETMIERGFIIPDDQLSEWNLYQRKVRKLTDRNRKKIFQNWNGLDHYDGEYIKDYLILEHTNDKFPCIDHKISVFNGFRNNITVEEISNIDNLCITKRMLNGSKKSSNEIEFISKLNITYHPSQ